MQTERESLLWSSSLWDLQYFLLNECGLKKISFLFVTFPWASIIKALTLMKAAQYNMQQRKCHLRWKTASKPSLKLKRAFEDGSQQWNPRKTSTLIPWNWEWRELIYDFIKNEYTICLKCLLQFFSIIFMLFFFY